MKPRLSAALFVSVFGYASLSEAATMAYVQDFSTTATGDNVPSGFTEGGTAGAANIQVVPFGADNGYQMTIANNAAYSSIPITNVSTANGQGFTFSAQFKLDALTATGGGSTAMTNNIVFLASSTDLSSSNNYRLGYNPAGLSSGGRLTLSEIGTANNFNVVPGQGTQGTANTGAIDSTGTLATSTSVTYTISVTAWYTGTTINLLGTLTDGTNTISVGATDTSPRNGTNFGMRIASNSASNTETLTWDNFSVQPYAIPEPATLALCASSAVLLFGRRRKR